VRYWWALRLGIKVEFEAGLRPDLTGDQECVFLRILFIAEIQWENAPILVDSTRDMVGDLFRIPCPYLRCTDAGYRRLGGSGPGTNCSRGCVVVYLLFRCLCIEVLP